MPKELDLGRVVGKDAMINGQNAIEIVGGKNISITNDEGTTTISLDGELDNPHFTDKDNPHETTAAQVGAVPITRTVNGKQLNEDITLTSEDTGSVPVDRTINNKPLSANITLSHTDVGAAPTSHGTHVSYGTTSPKMDGTASVGTDSKLARADHVHPSDTSKQDKLTGTPDQYVTFDENGNAVAKQKDYSLFGFQIDPDESDPSHNIKYIAQNASYDPAFMDYEKDEFNYGDWGDAWFIKGIKVVKLKPNGTIDYELDKNDYTKKFDSSVSYTSGYNVMVGIPTVWVRSIDLNGKYTFYFSDQKLSDDFHAYAHTAADGSIMPYTYLSAYNGYKDDNDNLRSLSEQTPTGSMTGTDQITAAEANNPTGKHMWNIDTFVDRQLINLLLLLIGKSTDTQTVFGNGNMNGYSNPASGAGTNGILSTGTMNDKGLFWGSNADNLGVKVFGIEHWWGNLNHRTQGLILDNGTYKMKLTYGTEDGSTVEGYNTTGEGYIDSGKSPSKFLGYFITNMHAGKFGLLPNEISGSATTYFCDTQFSNSTGKYLSLFGGCSNNGSHCGAFACYLGDLVSNSGWHIGACLSCKPY